MKIKEVNLILNDMNLQESECNFKLIGNNKVKKVTITDVAKNLNILLNKIVIIEDKINSIEKRMDNIEERIDNLEKRIDHLEQRIDHLEQRMDNLENKIDIGFKQVNKRINNIVKLNNLKE